MKFDSRNTSDIEVIKGVNSIYEEPTIPMNLNTSSEHEHNESRSHNLSKEEKQDFE